MVLEREALKWLLGKVRERKKAKSDFTKPNCRLLYDISARAENITFERKEQKLGPLECKKARSSAENKK